MKQMEVTILGQSYLLACPEGGEDLLRQAVSRVDQEMSAIRDAGKVKARERMAVLAALNLAYLLAEQRQTPAATVPVPASPPPSLEANLEEEALLDRLMSKLDATLGDDGQLL
jgi:cell division protein ZapA